MSRRSQLLAVTCAGALVLGLGSLAFADPAPTTESGTFADHEGFDNDGAPELDASSGAPAAGGLQAAPEAGAVAGSVEPATASLSTDEAAGTELRAFENDEGEAENWSTLGDTD